METRPTRVLMVEDDTVQAGLIRKMLAKTVNGSFEIDWVPQLSQGLERLDQGDIDVVLLDLGLEDSQGLDTFSRAFEKRPGLPFIVLTGLADENLGLAAVRLGAQDYLIKGKVDGPLLSRTIRYAMERRRSQEALLAERRRLYSLFDALPALVYVKAPDYAIRFANRGFRELFGSPEGKRCYEIIHGRPLPCEVCPAIEVIQTQKSYMGELTWPKNGRTYQVTHHPFSDMDGSPMVLTMSIDITERKQAEAAIKEREEQLTTIYENAPLIMMLVDGDRRVCKVNKLAEQFAGAAVADLLGRPGGEALGCLHALDDPRGCGFGPNCQDCVVRRTILDTFTNGRSHHQVEASLPFATTGKAPAVTFLLCTARLFVQGQPQVLVTIQDISERKGMEEALRSDEQFLEDIFNSIQDGLSILDLDRKVIRVNPAMKKFPFTEPMLGRKCFEVYHDRSEPCEPCPVTGTLKTGQANYGFVETIDESGDKKTVEIYSYPLINRTTGQLQGIIEYVRDVSERHKIEQALRETEGRFRLVFENAGDAMILHDQGRIIDVNRQACRSLGYSKDELLRMSVRDIEVGLDREFLSELWERENGGFTSLAGIHRRRDGSIFPVEINTAEVTYRGRKLRLAAIRDVTARQRAEEALKDSEKKLRFLTAQLLTAQEDERKRLSQGLHDELGHALLAMKLDLRALAKQLLPEQTGLAENVDELMCYVDEVLENVRRLYLDLTPGDLEDLGLTAALQNLCEEFGRHHEEISWSVSLDNIDALFPIRVQITVYRIFQEILTNIGKHANPTQVSVAVQRHNGSAFFTVKDNGKGFDMQAGWQSSPQGGMGLLAMGERVRMLGGDLQLWSQENQGTKITFTIPVT